MTPGSADRQEAGASVTVHFANIDAILDEGPFARTACGLPAYPVEGEKSYLTEVLGDVTCQECKARAQFMGKKP